ncbi:HlyD family secretion protein [Microvirga pudoricolor]|uniref:HlyD family secretion protein n=1 Tax=Microvirga pudoricolor TaxID=2778729 RepID=UPI00194E313C|nr:HlyD family secretion protein [Microvirga pudoricolor]MBM6594299.1 HlyD family secretion protein [Microvirga pudoricolor]
MAYREEFSQRGRGEPAQPSEPVPATESAPTAESVPTAKSAEPPQDQAAPVAAKAEDVLPKKKSGAVKKIVLGAVALAALGFGAYEGAHWWQTGRFMVSTDDAYIQADITILSAKISGYVDQVAVTNNQSVKAGDVIARIDAGDYSLALQAAKDKLATQESAVARIGRQIEAGRASVAQAEAQITAAKADSERAEADYDRQLQLSQSNYASRATFDAAKAARDRGEANVKSAQAALLAAQANVEVLAAQQVEAERGVAEQRTAVDKATRDLSFTEIRAPIDGVIGNKAVEVGTYVQPGTRLAALVPLSSVHIDANFKETQLASVQPGQKVHIEVDAFPDRDIVGTVESVSPASGSVFSLLPPENATGNFTKIVQRVPVRVKVNPDVVQQGYLRPGLSVVVNVDTREHEQATKTASVR